MELAQRQQSSLHIQLFYLMYEISENIQDFQASETSL